jgi:hypothetical protein
VEASFTVYARDRFGNLLLSGGDRQLTVIGRGSGRSATFVGRVAQDYGNGTYLVSALRWW